MSIHCDYMQKLIAGFENGKPVKPYVRWICARSSERGCPDDLKKVVFDTPLDYRKYLSNPSLYIETYDMIEQHKMQRSPSTLALFTKCNANWDCEV